MKCSELTILDTRDLVGNPKNPRKITTQSLNRLCDSIRQNGFWQHRPIAVEKQEWTDKWVVLDGNQRLKALRRMKRREAPCVIYSELTDEERDDIILRSNINNGEWDVDMLQVEFEQTDFEAIGLQIELPDPPEIATPTTEAPTTETSDNDEDDVHIEDNGEEPEETEQPKTDFYLKMLGDFVYPSNNEFDIPTLKTDNMPVHLELPINPWGAEARYKKGMMTYHFYVDDYRFEQLFKDPIKLLESGVHAIVEPNCSIHDQTPMAHAIFQTYRKRYLCRYLQECGMQIWVDLNVSPHFEEINALGVPEGYNAFCTRGVSGWIPTTERHWEMAKRISGKEKPNMFVYGGGEDVAEWCKAHDVVHVKEYINRHTSKEKAE